MKSFYLLFFSSLLFPLLGTAQCASQERGVALLQMMRLQHLAPLDNSIDNNRRVLEQFIQLADPMHILYCNEDVLTLMQQSSAILDTTGADLCQFTAFALQNHRAKLTRFQTELTALTAQPPQFNLADSLQIFPGMHPPRIHADDAARKTYFRQIIHLMTLLEADGTTDTQEETSKADELKKQITANAQRIAANVRQSMECRMDPQNLWKDDAKAHIAIEQILFEAIALAHDPHSSYFNTTGINDFMSQISSDQVSYGITIDENEWHEKVIVGLRPGSDAWKSNQIHINDKITAIWLDHTPVEGLNCISPEDLESTINNGTHKKITLELQKPSGQTTKVTLKPELITGEEHVITSFVLKNDHYSIGYIALPAFYSSSDWWIDKGCANDVGKEILKLKKDSIQGLILDLRYNGGGSVSEAIDLAGLFIDVGPIGLQKMRNEKPFILKEMSKGILYTGPLAILVNNFSASAAELSAGALQDYNRALIVGHNTFGKGTSQHVLPVFTSNELTQKEPTPFGYLKTTTSGIYRINNATYQGVGIHPDIALPNPMVNLQFNEKNESHPLVLASIDKKLFYSPFPPMALDSLRLRSSLRIEQSPYYSKLSRRSNQWPQYAYAVHLHPDRFQESMVQMQQYQELTDEIDQTLLCPFTVLPASSNQALTQMDQAHLDEYQNQKNLALSDAELQECFNIVADLIQYSKK